MLIELDIETQGSDRLAVRTDRGYFLVANKIGDDEMPWVCITIDGTDIRASNRTEIIRAMVGFLFELIEKSI